jgi:SOS-response transcriptional repressor LexA
MDGTISDRIDQLLRETGKSAASASREAGMSPDFIRDLKRKPKVKPGAESLTKLANVLNTTPEYLLYGKADASVLPVKGLPVVGVVEAGQFRDITLIDQDEEHRTVNVVKDGRYPQARQYALRVSGDSMDQMFADGSYVICVSFADTGLNPKSGMIVHVERRIAGTHLVETTLKEVEYRGRRCFLLPRSTNTKHKPIEIHPDDEKTETVIQGLVIGAYTEVRF